MDTKAAFEKWCSEKGYSTEQFHYGNWAGQYKMESVRNKWEGWKESRAAIEISPVEEYSDSPLDIIYEQPDNLSRDEVTQFGYMRGYNDCLNELSTSHGIRIKGKTE